MLLVLLFMYIFSFPFGPLPAHIVNSTNIVGVFLLVLLVMSISYREEVIKVFTNRRVLLILGFNSLLILFSFFIIIFHQSNDYSILPTLFNLLGKLVIGCLLLSLYRQKYEKRLNEGFIIVDLVKVFIIQSLIQLVSLLITPIRIILNFFRPLSTIELSSKYSSSRGLAVSGSGFFGLAVAYSLIFFFYIVYRKKFIHSNKKISKTLYFLFFSLLIFGGISSGRTSLIGIIFGLLYVLVEKLYLVKKFPQLKDRSLHKSSRKLRIITVTSIAVLLFVAMIIGFYLIYTYKSVNDVPIHLKRIFSLSRYLLDPFYTYFHFGKFEISSLNTLFDMYFPVSWRIFLIGEGKYSALDGGYYMSTDGGYMRNILFFGVFGFVLLLVFQLSLFDWKDKKYRWQNIFILIMILVLHYKGEVLGFSQITLSMLLLVNLSKNDSFNKLMT